MPDHIMKPESGGNPKAAQVRIGMRSAAAIGGQRAHDLRIGPQPKYVDASRRHLNRVLVEPLTGTKLGAICKDRRALRKTVRAMKSNASVGVAGILTFGHEAQKIFEKLTLAEQDAAYLEAAEAVATCLNTTLTGLVAHGDESAPHAHFQLPAYDLAGQPISETAKRAVLRDLQTITAEVMGRHAPGIERGRSKNDRLKAGASPADVVNKSVQQLHDELPAEIAAKESELAEVKAKLDKNAGLLAKAQADLARITEDAGAESDKAEKIRKRAETYEKRVDAAQADFDRLTSSLAMIQKAQAEAEAQAKATIADARAKAEVQARAIIDDARIQAEVQAKAIISDASAHAQRVTEKAGAVMAATVALMEEIEAGTLGITTDGKAVARDLAAISKGFPDLQPAFFASVKAAERLRRKEAKADRLIARLSEVWDSLTSIFRRKDMPLDAQIKGEAALRSVEKDVGKRVPLPTLPGFGRSRPAQQPVKPSEGPSGP